jgi:hypothetical protein
MGVVVDKWVTVHESDFDVDEGVLLRNGAWLDMSAGGNVWAGVSYTGGALSLHPLTVFAGEIGASLRAFVESARKAPGRPHTPRRCAAGWRATGGDSVRPRLTGSSKHVLKTGVAPRGLRGVKSQPSVEHASHPLHDHKEVSGAVSDPSS